MALNNRQKTFVHEYLKCFNATKSALLAGYSQKTAYAIGHENLNKVEIKSAIEKALEQSAMSANEVLMRLASQARSEYSKYILDNGRVDLKSLLADNKGHLIKSVKMTSDGVQVEFFNSQLALTTLAKRHGLLSDRLEVRIENELSQALDLLKAGLDPAIFEDVLKILST